MPISLVSGGNLGASLTNGGDPSVTLPTLQQNDLVYVAYASANSTHSMITEGYTQVGSTLNQGTHYLSLWRKKMGATPDSTAQVEGGGNADHGVAMAVYCLRGVDGTTPEDVTPVSAVGTTTAPDSPSISPTTSGAWVLSIGTNDATDAVVILPTGYADRASANANDALDSTIAIGWKAWSGSGAEDPAAWTGWAAGTYWIALSVAVRPDTTVVKDIIQSHGFIAFAR